MTAPRSMNVQTVVSCNYEFTSHSTAQHIQSLVLIIPL